MIELVERVTEVDGHPPLSEHKYATVTSVPPGRRAPVGFVAENDSIVGLAALVPATVSREWGLELAVDPAHREGGIVELLVDLAVDAIATRGGGLVRLWSYTDDVVADPTELGFSPERRLHRMGRPLDDDPDPDLPEGVAVRAFRPGVDEDAWLAVNNAAFAGHPENGRWDGDDLAERMAMPWFDPEGFRMAWEGEELVGFCWTKIHPDGDGEIYVIAAAPGQQGRGLGRVLVVEGMRYLAEQRVPRVFLYCEADNTSALQLYERLGFGIERTHRAAVRSV